MAQMQMVIAAIYSKYKTTISPKTTDASMEIVDQITSAGPIVSFILCRADYQSHHCFLEFHPVE